MGAQNVDILSYKNNTQIGIQLLCGGLAYFAIYVYFLLTWLEKCTRNRYRVGYVFSFTTDSKILFWIIIPNPRRETLRFIFRITLFNIHNKNLEPTSRLQFVLDLFSKFYFILGTILLLIINIKTLFTLQIISRSFEMAYQYLPSFQSLLLRSSLTVKITKCGDSCFSLHCVHHGHFVHLLLSVNVFCIE